jgi:pyrroloquinoline quinone biosynthesis protein B
LRVRVLGSAAGGGFPQWNCGCPRCAGVRSGSLSARPRTQESVAIRGERGGWLLVNASPEVRAQLESFPPLHPRAPRDTPVEGVVLVNGDLDHVLGLLSLREGQRLVVHATAAVREGFTAGNVLARTLARFPGQVTWRELPLGREIPLDDGLAVRAVPSPGKPPIHLDGLTTPAPGDNVALVFRDLSSGARVAYAPAVARLDPALRDALDGVDALFFDGTFWSEDELPSLGLGEKRAADMAHLPVSDSLRALADLRAGRRVLIHVNNTNPILDEASPERAEVVRAGWEVAWDGMEVEA